MGFPVGQDDGFRDGAGAIRAALCAGAGSVYRAGAGGGGGTGDAEGFPAGAEAVHRLPGGGDDLVLVGFGADGGDGPLAVAESGGGRGGN